MSSLPINSTASRSYDEQITKALDNYYSSPSKKTPIEKLRLRRNQLIREAKAVLDKFFGLEQAYFSNATALVNQATELSLSIDILDELPLSNEQQELWAKLVKEDKYLSNFYQAYEQELIELDLDILSLQSQYTPAVV
jgi:hypothetical protein